MSTQTVSKSVKPERRYDVDWLRVLAVLLLFPFHIGLIFHTRSNWYIKNDQLSNVATYFVTYLNPWSWYMPLLFVLAGAAAWFALGFRSGRQYAVERFKRLFIPFIVWFLVLVPPQSYLKLRSQSSYNRSFLEWYPNFFNINPADLDGYFMGKALSHMWLILYLFVFALVALPLFLFLKTASGQRVVGWLATFCSRPGAILLLAIPIYLARRLFISFHPNPVLYLTYFVYGYLLFADARFEEAIDRHKVLALLLGPIPFIVVVYFEITSWPGIPSWSLPITRFYVGGLAPWLFIIAILAYGRRFLNFSNEFLRYAGPASYPYFILHQTVIIIIGFYVVQSRAGVPVKYGLILVATIVVTAAVYELVVKRFNIARFLFGLSPKKQPIEEKQLQAAA